MNRPTMAVITFRTYRAARRFLRGYCVERVIVPTSDGRGFEIVHPRTAKRRGFEVRA